MIKKGDTLQTAASKPHGGIALYKDILANGLSPAKGTQVSGVKQEALEEYINKKSKADLGCYGL